MIPQAEQHEAQERLRRMKLVADYLQTTTADDDPLRISFVNYLSSYAASIGATPAIDPILLTLQARAGQAREASATH